jgi:hypothetical protein
MVEVLRARAAAMEGLWHPLDACPDLERIGATIDRLLPRDRAGHEERSETTCHGLSA